MKSRRRVPWVGLALVTLFALLMSFYRYLDDVARANAVPPLIDFIEEFTGVFAAASLLPAVRWMARRFPVTRNNWLRQGLVHGCALVLFSIVHTTLNWTSREILFPLAGLGNYDYGLMPVRYFMEFPIDVVLYTLFAIGTTVFDRREKERQRELETAQLATRLTDAQLQNLQLQLQPHFLFNALNTISSRMYDDPRAADTMIARLAELLRLSLRTATTQEVPLAVELEALGHYMALLVARFGDALQHEVVVTNDVGHALVPAFVLQPLVENAVRHGNLAREGHARIDVRARAANQRLILEVEDDGPGLYAPLTPARAEGVDHGGLGLVTTRERLRLLYGDAQQLRLERGPLGGLLVRIEIPLRGEARSGAEAVSQRLAAGG